MNRPSILSGEELVFQMPLSARDQAFIASARLTIENIINGIDPRLLLIVGPCSIHEERALYEYGEKLKRLNERVSSHIFIVMRGYLEKPRTRYDWKGFLYDPDLDGSCDIAKGVIAARKILLNLTALSLPIGCELLELTTAHYYADLLSWGCIGARTCTSQPHRQWASSFPFPIGFKNSPDGKIENAIHGMISAHLTHTFLGITKGGRIDKVKTKGNPLCHLILRGGENGPNYDPHSVAQALEKCAELGVRQKILIDCAHDNSQKSETAQISVFESVLEQILEGNQGIVGMMLESHLFGGQQTLKSPLRYGISVTDPCLDWTKTERLILHAQERLTNSPSHIDAVPHLMDVL